MHAVALEKGLGIVLVGTAENDAVVVHQAVFAGIHDRIELGGGLGVLTLPEIHLAQEGLRELLGHVPGEVVIGIGFLLQETGIDGLGEVGLHQVPQVFVGTVGDIVLGRSQFVVHERRVAPHRLEVEVGESAEHLGLGDGGLGDVSKFRIHVAQDDVRLVDQRVEGGEHILHIVLLGIEGELVQVLQVGIVAAHGAARPEVVGEHGLAQFHIVFPAADLQVHGHFGRLDLVIGLIVGVIVQHTVLRDVQFVGTGGKGAEGCDGQKYIACFHKAVGIRK